MLGKQEGCRGGLRSGFCRVKTTFVAKGFPREGALCGAHKGPPPSRAVGAVRTVGSWPLRVAQDDRRVGARGPARRYVAGQQRHRY